MTYNVIYDGDCNLCTNLVKLLEKLDKGHLFQYVPMQDRETLELFDVTPTDCEMGMILIEADRPTNRWQGSAAAEEIGRLLPLSRPLIAAYRALPGMKWIGDRTYEQVRDYRYELFGRRSQTYYSPYPVGCKAVEPVAEIKAEILNPHDNTVVS
jgi:predicted DCC family thiol-disulfide oxidoreductase YuxK